MKLTFNGKLTMTSHNFMRRCGYGHYRNREGIDSYTLRLGRAAFPRFHVYVDQKDDTVTLNLHLDQKAACYDGSSAHSGEYDGQVVEEEGGRLTRWMHAVGLQK